MDLPEGASSAVHGGIDRAATMLRAAADAHKRCACGCLRHPLDTMDRARPLPGGDAALEAALASTREYLLPQRYECLGCDICYPAVALKR
jgi:tetrahydromethanopterin S-methyltransferase subunit A